MPIGSSDGMYYKDEFDRATGRGVPVSDDTTKTKNNDNTIAIDNNGNDKSNLPS